MKRMDTCFYKDYMLWFMSDICCTQLLCIELIRDIMSELVCICVCDIYGSLNFMSICNTSKNCNI